MQREGDLSYRIIVQNRAVFRMVGVQKTETLFFTKGLELEGGKTPQEEARYALCEQKKERPAHAGLMDVAESLINVCNQGG